eukprot:gene9457-10447_t
MTSTPSPVDLDSLETKEHKEISYWPSESPAAVKDDPPASGPVLRRTSRHSTPNSFRLLDSLLTSASKTPRSSSKRRSSAASATQKKKMAELQEEIEDMENNLDKLKKEKTRLTNRLSRLTALANNGEAVTIRYPIEDELLADPSSLVLPSQSLSEQLPGVSASEIADLIAVWDFLCTFQQELQLQQKLSWHDWVAILTYRGTIHPLPALIDLYLVLLRFLFQDQTLLQKAMSSLPKRVYFAQASPNSMEEEDAAAGRRDSILPPQLHTGIVNPSSTSFDAEYRGFYMLPRNAAAWSLDAVDALRGQVLLRALLLRLEPVRRMRKAVGEMEAFFQTASNQKDLGLSAEDLAGIHALNSQFWGTEQSSYFTNSSSATHSPFSLDMRLLERLLDPSTRQSSFHHGGNDDPSLNIDVYFEITCSLTERLKRIYEVACLLEATELEELSLRDHAVLLRVLIDSCCDTKRIQVILAKNADAVNSAFVQLNKQLREQKNQAKEATASLRSEAIQGCRKRKFQEYLREYSKSPKKGGKKLSLSSRQFDPTPDQISAFMEEMVMLRHYGIDEVVEDEVFEEDEEDDNKEQEGDGDEERHSSRPSRSTRSGRKRDRDDDVEERRERREAVEAVHDKIEYALERGRERDFRIAIKAAERAGLRAEGTRGKVTCTEKLKLVYKALYDLESQRKEATIFADHQATLVDHPLRSEVLGQDRHRADYFLFRGQPDAVFRCSSSHSKVSCGDGAVVSSSSRGAVAQAVCRLYASRPSLTDRLQGPEPQWTIMQGETEIEELFSSLDYRGNRERALQSRLKESFPSATEASAEGEGERWRMSRLACQDHYLSAVVVRRAGRRRVVLGRVLGRLIVERSRQPVEQDEEEGKETDSLKAREKAKGKGKAGGAEEKAKKEEEEAEDGVEEDVNEEGLLERMLHTPEEVAEVMDQQPIVQALGLRGKAVNANEVQPGLRGLVFETSRFLHCLYQTLQKYHPAREERIVRAKEVLWSGEDSWRHRLKLSENQEEEDDDQEGEEEKDGADRKGAGEEEKDSASSYHGNLRAFCTSLLAIEEAIYSLQSVPDKHDFEEKRRREEEQQQEKAQQRVEMVKEGWIFWNQDQQEELPSLPLSTEEIRSSFSPEAEEVEAYLGLPVRRFFPRYGYSDGHVEGLLPASRNDGIALYRIVHDDGDEEDVDTPDLLRALLRRRQNVTKVSREELAAENEDQDEEEEEKGGKDAEDESGSEGGDSHSETGSSGSDSSEEEEDDENMAGDRLWPTWEVRQRWRSFLRRAILVSEVAWALFALEQQAYRFNILAQDFSVLPQLFQPPSPSPSLTASSAKRTGKRQRTRSNSIGSEDSGRVEGHHMLLSPRKARHGRLASLRGSAGRESATGRPQRSAARRVINYAS